MEISKLPIYLPRVESRGIPLTALLFVSPLFLLSMGLTMLVCECSPLNSILKMNRLFLWNHHSIEEIWYYKVSYSYAIERSYLSTVVAAAENLAWSWWLYFGIASAWWCQWQPRSGYQIRRFKRVSLKNRYFGTSITFKCIFYPRNDICVRS